MSEQVTTYGFTGTQKGMTPNQKQALRKLLGLDPGFFRHGDCIKADAEAHAIATALAWTVLIHPPTNATKRAWCRAETIFPPKPYLERNRDIVDRCDALIAAPDGFRERIRSGTWYTVRYANKRNKPTIIVYPDGTIERTNGA